MLDKAQENKPKNEFFDNIAIDISLFVAAVISMLALIAIIHIVCRHAKLKALLLNVYICLSNQKCTLFKRRLYSNTVTIMLFFSDIKQYVPVKLCKSAGSIHSFQLYGQLDSNQIILEKIVYGT